jgi:alpha-tubulin suppressor-like RCC1 family protein
MSGFNSSSTGDFDKYFMTTTDLIDRYAIGGLWAWGINSSGRLGDNTINPKSSPVQTISGGTNWKEISCGYTHTAAIKTDGTLWIWGRNTYGQLGDNSISDTSSPIQTISGGTNWKQVSVGRDFTAAIKTDGTLWTWGYNFYGQLGNNSANNTSSPVQTIAFGTNWKQVSAGQFHIAAIKTDGTLWSWGRNGQGQLGNNSANNTSSPVQTITFGTNWKQVSCGYHTTAVKTDGTLWSWGYNGFGGLGDNTATPKSSPVQTITFGTNWKQVSVGRDFTAAIKTDGTLWTWGYNFYGGLGDNTISHKSSPVQTITFGTNWKQVDAGQRHTGAIKTDGTLWTWGRDNYGQLGDNSISDKSSPVQTIAFGSNWKQVSCGYFHTAAVQYSDIGQVL